MTTNHTRARRSSANHTHVKKFRKTRRKQIPCQPHVRNKFRRNALLSKGAKYLERLYFPERNANNLTNTHDEWRNNSTILIFRFYSQAQILHAKVDKASNTHNALKNTLTIVKFRIIPNNCKSVLFLNSEGMQTIYSCWSYTHGQWLYTIVLAISTPSTYK